KPLGNSVLAGNTDTVQVQRHTRENRVGAGTESGTVGTDGSVSLDDRCHVRVIKGWIKIPHAIVGLIGVRNAVPAQSQIERQLSSCPPVVLNVSSPGRIVPESVILHGQFVVAFGCTEQEVREIASRERAVKAKGALRLPEQILNFLVECPA